MKLIFSIIITLVLSNSVFAQNIEWSQFDHAFSTKAEYQETSFGFFATLQKIESSGQMEQREYFSSVGGFNEKNEFIASRYEIASEKWELIGDKLYIDQWLFVLNTNHQLRFKLHRTMIQRLDGVLLNLENIPESDEVYSQKTNDILEGWMKSL
jgi:hypothetical protein